MDANKVFEDIIWADVVIEQDELKAIREFPIKELTHKDLCAVYSQLKIKGVNNASKYAMLEKIVSVFMFKKKGMVSSSITQRSLLHHQERSPTVLTDY